MLYKLSPLCKLPSMSSTKLEKKYNLRRNDDSKKKRLTFCYRTKIQKYERSQKTQKKRTHRTS